MLAPEVTESISHQPAVRGAPLIHGTKEGTPLFFHTRHTNEHMQHGLKILLNTSTITQVDWLKLIDARVRMIQPHMGEFSLNRLDMVANHLGLLPAHKINTMIKGDMGFDRQMQGIFGKGTTASYGNQTTHRGELHYFWGLTRNCDWIGVILRYEGPMGKVRLIEVEHMHFGDRCDSMLSYIGISPRAVWEGIGAQIEFWDRKLKEKAYTLGLLMPILNAEKMMVHWRTLGSEASSTVEK